MNLSELKDNDQAIIVKVRGHGSFRKRIIEMGFVRGKKVTVIKNAPLKDPIEYQIMDYQVSLRRSEAAHIEVMTVEEGESMMHEPFQGVHYEERLRNLAFEKRKFINIAFVGNPNSGKTTLFNRITGSYEHVGNFSGVTVDAKLGFKKHNGYTFNIVDLPGTYSLTTYSPEEKYVRNHILQETPDIIVNVIDSSNLERNLYLTTQLIDMDLRVVAALNMYDEMSAKGLQLDYNSLGKMIGMPFVPTIASKGKGIEELLDKIIEVYEDLEPVVRHVHINYGEATETAIRKIRDTLSSQKEIANKVSLRFLSIKLLENDSDALELINRLQAPEPIFERTKKEIHKLETFYGTDCETVITEAKYGFIAGALRETSKQEPVTEKIDSSRIIDTFVTHKLFGFPIFFLFLYIMFRATFTLGQYPMNWLESGVALLQQGVGALLSEGPLRDLLADGIIGGMGAVLVFLPNILILYFFISFMEDSGYMARAAFIMDRVMHKIGLHGKSFIPLIMGFGCNVPAVIATRTIEDRRNRLLTMLMIPFMSCSARLPVYILIVGSFFPERAGLILLSIYLLGILIAILFGRFFNKVVFKKREAPFVMELPPYRLPSLRSTSIHMWKRGEQYLRKIGGIILISSITIWMLGYFPHNTHITEKYEAKISQVQHLPDSVQIIENEMVAELQANSYLGRIGRFIEPAIEPLGFNWKIGVSLLSGIPAKEIIISTLSVLYQTDTDEPLSLSERLRQPVISSHGQSEGLSKAGALALVIFVLLYFPCLATVASIKAETGSWNWAVFSVVFTTVLAYLLAWGTYQIAIILM
jgi:ferrous iron transport protein B